MLTRGQVAQRLGRSIATVRRMEGSRLHPTLSSRGVHLFEEDEVATVVSEVMESGRALEQAPIISAHEDHPTWTQFDELQAENAELERRLLENDIVVEGLREQLEEYRVKASQSEDEKASNAIVIRRDQHTQKKWLTNLDEACAMLIHQIDEPDRATCLIVDAIVELLESRPTSSQSR